jgi:membrane protein insertase Oxa1/YidC/SpoIIIJ
MSDVAAAQPTESVEELIEALLAENLNAIEKSRKIPVSSIYPLLAGIRKFIKWGLSIFVMVVVVVLAIPLVIFGLTLPPRMTSLLLYAIHFVRYGVAISKC